MEKVVVPVHEHPLFLFDRFCMEGCKGCGHFGYFYGGYLCNELGCDTLFHKECAKSLPGIKHPSDPKHPLKLKSSSSSHLPTTLENSKTHEHPLLLSKNVRELLLKGNRNCKVCNTEINNNDQHLYECRLCNMLFHWECVGLIPDVYHTCHPKHLLKFFKFGAPAYADENCLLCGMKFEKRSHNCDHLYHCDVCNVTLCEEFCMANPPPVSVVSPTTHEHQLHLAPRLINFTCNACGTAGDRSPYFCLQCNIMIHRDCTDLPRIININRHNHRISYTRHLGHGNWKCGVCRKKVDGFYGGYSCSKCPSYAVHARCAMRYDVWDKVELEGTPEEEEISPFVVVDENQIKHFSHGHNLRLNKAGEIIHESKLCEACVSQISNDPFYGCEQCDYLLHETCASLPIKIRHVSNIFPFTLQTYKDRRDNSPRKRRLCDACFQYFTGFRY